MNKVVHYLVHKPGTRAETSPKLPFTLMVQDEFQKKNINVHIQETSFEFGNEELAPFLQELGIEKDHFVCFDEIICKKFSTAFSKALIDMKDNVAALWIAIGAKPVVGSFSLNQLKKQEKMAR